MDNTFTQNKNKMSKVFFSNPKLTFVKKKTKILNSISKVIDNGIYIKGKNVLKFENSFKNYIGTKYCVGTANATDSIYIALKALNIKKTDEVITTSLTATATGLAIKNSGANIKFVDICEKCFCIDINQIEKSITKKTKAIVYVHLYGQGCNIEFIKKLCKKYKISLIEDCAQAAGAKFKNYKVGSYGDISVFSFFPTKNLPCLGDGGALVTNNINLYKKIKAMAQYGWNEERDSIYQGINSRLDEVQAAILRLNLKDLNKMNSERRKIARYYLTNIKNKKIILPKETSNSLHVFHLFVIRVKNRNKLLKIMNKNNIYCGIHYKLPVHKQKIFKSNFKLDKTERAVSEIVSLPIFPGLKLSDQKKIVSILNNF